MYFETQLHFHMDTQGMVIRIIDCFFSLCSFRYGFYFSTHPWCRRSIVISQKNWNHLGRIIFGICPKFLYLVFFRTCGKIILSYVTAIFFFSLYEKRYKNKFPSNRVIKRLKPMDSIDVYTFRVIFNFLFVCKMVRPFRATKNEIK